jgi:hypothetical protein
LIEARAAGDGDIAGRTSLVRPLLCYGLAFLWCVPDVAAKRRPITLLAATFLLCGLARLASVVFSGPPNTFYSVMLVIEPMWPFARSSRLRGYRNLLDGERLSVCHQMHSRHLVRPQSQPMLAP